MLLVSSLKVNNIKKSLRNFFIRPLNLSIFEYKKVLSNGFFKLVHFRHVAVFLQKIYKILQK